MEVKKTDSIPDYIQEFISLNKEQLIKLFLESKEENNLINYVFMKCNEEENKMNVSYIDIIQLKELFNNDIVKNIVSNNYNLIIHELKLFPV